MLRTIRRQQDDMRSTLKAAEAILIRSGDLETVELGQIRWQLALQLKTYTEFKHQTVFPTLLQSSDPVVRELSMRMRGRCDAIGVLYKAYLADWSVVRVFEQKAKYRVAALEMIGRLRQHFEREQADVVRLTERPEAKPVCLPLRAARSGF